MSQYGEPKNGDYVAYIEALVNRGANSPGQVARAARKRARWSDALRPAGSADDGAPLSWPSDGGFATPGPGGAAGLPDAGRAGANPMPPMAPSPGEQVRPARRAQPVAAVPRASSRGPAMGAGPGGAPGAAGAGGAPPTLAKAAALRKQGLAMLGVAAAMAVVAFNMMRDALARGEAFDEFLPALFFLLFAFIFMRAGLRVRRSAGAAQPALPPLSTLPRRPAGRDTAAP